MFSPSKEEVEKNFELLRKDLEGKIDPEEEGAPERIFIAHDDYHASCIGVAANGRQFFLTGLFIAELNDRPGNEFEALFLFDQGGSLVDSVAIEWGPRSTFDEELARKWRAERLSEIGPISYEDIMVKPFAVEHFGVMMGLIPFWYGGDDDDDDDDDGRWKVELHPGNFMAFYPPWDSGIYDT